MIMDIVIRVLNNEKNILNTYNKIEEELKNIKHRYIFVDDNSDDKSLEILKGIQSKNESTVKVIELSKRHGKDTSIYAGLSNTTHELVCIYDLDLNANISYITKMYDYLKENKDYDQVCMMSNHKESFIKNTEIKFLNFAFDLKINNNKTYYRLLKRKVVDALIETTKNYPFSSYSFELLGYNTSYIKFDNSNIDNKNLSKNILYSEKPFVIIKSINLILITILILLLLMAIFKIIKINTIILIMCMLLFYIVNLLFINMTFKFLSKEKTYFTINEKIGFDDNIL